MLSNDKVTRSSSILSDDPEFSISPGYANYVLGVLFVVYMFNFIDRQALSVFIGPIKDEFGASDTAIVITSYSIHYTKLYESNSP